MRVTCPQCGFSRRIPDEKIPETAELATCPKCSRKFRFRTLERTPEQASVQAPEQAPDKTPGPGLAEDFWAGLEKMAPPGEQEPPAPEVPEHGGDQVEIEVPFENLRGHGFFPGLWMTIRRAMFSPRLFFRVMPMRGLGGPLAFYLLLFEFSLVLDLLWGRAGLPPISGLHPALAPLDPGLGGPVGPVTLFAVYPIMATIIVFGASAGVHLVLKLMRSGERGFEGTFRAQAYSNAPLILSVLPYGYLLGIAWGLVVFVIGLKNVHRTSTLKVALAFGLLLAIQALLAWWAVNAGLRAMPDMTGGAA